MNTLVSFSLCNVTGVGELPVPRGLIPIPDLRAQTLSLTWQSESSLFDLEIFHTELMNVVLNVSALTPLHLTMSFQLLICVVVIWC